jgi:histidinol-phosphate aminotransferase
MHFKEYIQKLPPYKPAQLISHQVGALTKLSSNENPLGPSPKAMAALEAAIGNVHRYPDAGAGPLRAALAQRAGLPPTAVTCSNGSDELILLLCLAFLGEGDEVVMAEGTFVSYLIRTLELGATPVRVPLRNYAHDLPAMARAITPRTRMVFVCNPNNPTGTTSGATEVREFLARVPEDVLVVMDEAYVEFATRPDYPDLLPELRDGRTNLLLLRTFAKIYGLAGLRLGYAFAHPDLVAYLDRVRPTFNVNLLAQVAGVAALEDSEHLVRSREHAAAARSFFEQALRGMGLEPIAGETNFIAFAVPDEAATSAGLFERGFSVTPLKGWGLPGLLRVSFGTHEENERFVSVLREVLAQ